MFITEKWDIWNLKQNFNLEQISKPESHFETSLFPFGSFKSLT